MISNIYKKAIYGKITFIKEGLSKILPSFNDLCVITSSSAWKSFIHNYPEYQNPARLIINPSIQVDAIRKAGNDIHEKTIIGIGGGRVIDATKAIAYHKKIPCILLPTVLSTTAWLNPTASLKIGNIVKHSKGKYNRILIDSQLISSAPPHLTYGGLMDILVGYNGIVDWRLKNQKKGGYYPRNAELIVKEFCDKVVSFLTNNPIISPEIVPIIVDYFIEAMANCFGLLSGYPLESSEHFLYYAIEEYVDRELNHGSVISLCMLICTILQEDRALFTPDQLIQLFHSLKINYKLSNLGISWELFIRIIKNMDEFVKQKKLPFSLWNLQRPHKNYFIDKINAFQNMI